MSDEAAFLAAIAAAPNDSATRLVYADWLEDHGDLRADGMRAECKYHKGVRLLKLPRPLWKLREKLDHDWVALVTRPPLADAITAALAEITTMVPGLNYVVWFGLYRLPLRANATPHHYYAGMIDAHTNPTRQRGAHRKSSLARRVSVIHFRAGVIR